MNTTELQIKNGSWLYSNEVPTRISIVQRNFSSGSGDLEDPKEIREDQTGIFYNIIYYSSSEKNTIVSESGAFTSLSKAELYCFEATNNTVVWDNEK